MPTLSEVQGPLKQRYRDDPDAAKVLLSATGQLGAGVSCSLETGKAMAEAGLHPATDADDEQLATLQKLTERYCVVLQTLTGGPAVTTEVLHVRAVQVPARSPE